MARLLICFGCRVGDADISIRPSAIKVRLIDHVFGCIHTVPA